MKEFMMWMLENGENLVACFLEIFMILLCIHGVFKAKFKFSIENVLIILADLIMIILINMKVVARFYEVIIYILLFGYCIWKFRKKFWETLGRFVLSFILISVIQIVSGILTTPIVHILKLDSIFMMLVNEVGVLLSFIIFRIPHFKKNRIRFNLNKEKWGPLIGICGFSFVFLLIDYRLRGETEPIYYLVFLVACVIACVSSLSAQAARHELEKQKLEMEMQKIYGDTYKELITEVRRKQHDFSNQLGAIYSMHLTSNSLEELIEKQSGYGKVLLEESRYDKILVGCNNSILAGYLYYRCVAYEKSDVQVEYQIYVDEAKCCLSLHEVIEILGILLTNAFEHCCMRNGEKRIGLTVQEGKDSLMIEVGNEAEELTSREIEDLFREGYSTKGENRGLGLPRVKELTERIKADLIVENRKKDMKNWIHFRVRIPKYEGE